MSSQPTWKRVAVVLLFITGLLLVLRLAYGAGFFFGSH